MRKAFIAAPLIGTIIFVTAVVFVVNINKAETNAITQIAQESYHNRINSIVELYRSDAGSLFREDVKKVVEQALTSQCWNIFDVRVPNSPGDAPSEKAEKLRIARFNSCKEIKSTVQSVVCSNTGESADLNAANACREFSSDSTAYANCLAQNGGGSRTYGLQNFFNNINQEFSFEGITLSPSNQEKFASFFNPRDAATGSVDLVQYISNCKNLIKELTIDCDAFAGSEAQAPKLQCCKVNTGDDYATRSTCAPEDVIPGCENGIFYIKIKPSEQGIFESLPRIQAKDDAGNYLRAGAISDVEEFYLPITFPLMKYLDASFNAYKTLAFGANIGENDQESEGVLDGICYAGGLCTSNVFLARDVGYVRSSGDQSWQTTSQAEDALSEIYYRNVFKPAFEAMPGNLEISMLSSGLEVARCKKTGIDRNGPIECTGTNGGDGDQAVKQLIRADSFQEAGLWYPYIADLTLNFRIVDTDPSFKVKPDANNELCTSAILNFNP